MTSRRSYKEEKTSGRSKLSWCIARVTRSPEPRTIQPAAKYVEPVKKMKLQHALQLRTYTLRLARLEQGDDPDNAHIPLLIRLSQRLPQALC